MPFPPQVPQGPLGFGQPRPPLMGYGGTFSPCTFFMLMGRLSISQTTIDVFTPTFQQVDLLTHQTSTEEAEETMIASGDKVATWGSHATSGETTVRVIFILP